MQIELTGSLAKRFGILWTTIGDNRNGARGTKSAMCFKAACTRDRTLFFMPTPFSFFRNSKAYLGGTKCLTSNSKQKSTYIPFEAACEKKTHQAKFNKYLNGPPSKITEILLVIKNKIFTNDTMSSSRASMISAAASYFLSVGA